MGNLGRHVFATVASLLFVFLWLTAGNPDALGPWIALLAQGAAPCAANPIVCENQYTDGAGTAVPLGAGPKGAWDRGKTLSMTVGCLMP